MFKPISYTIKTALCLFLLISPTLAHDIIGYLPNYRINQQTLNSIKHCTDIVFFGSELAEDGTIQLPKGADTQLTQIQNTIQQQSQRPKTRLILCIGGWGKDKHFPTVTSSPIKRKRFAQSLLSLRKKYQFAGVDLDWEYPRNAKQWQDLGKLIEAGKTQLKASGNQPLIWSTAVNPNHVIPDNTIKHFDRIHLMTYDIGKHHCDPAIAQQTIKKWQARGVPSNKLCIGAAFYGRKIDQRSVVKTYAEIHKQYGNLAETTQHAGGFYYDNPVSCKAKRNFVQQNKLRGIIIWEIGQDAPGKAALLPLLK